MHSSLAYGNLWAFYFLIKKLSYLQQEASWLLKWIRHIDCPHKNIRQIDCPHKNIRQIDWVCRRQIDQ